MSTLRLLAYNFALELATERERRRSSKPQVILVLAHARSGSTLLTHLLANHPKIWSLGERSRPYRTDRDYDRLTADVRVRRRMPFAPIARVVDQLNDSELWNEGLLRDRVQTILLIREPRSAIASMVRLAERFGKDMSAVEYLEYYVERVKTLGRYVASVDARRAIGLDYDELVDEPERTLSVLSDFIGLQPALTAEYQLQPFTGRYGDQTEGILTGRIERVIHQEEIDLSGVDLEPAHEAYRSCRRSFARLQVKR